MDRLPLTECRALWAMSGATTRSRRKKGPYADANIRTLTSYQSDRAVPRRGSKGHTHSRTLRRDNLFQNEANGTGHAWALHTGTPPRVRGVCSPRRPERAAPWAATKSNGSSSSRALSG